MPAYYLVYDDTCPMCVVSVAKVRQLDRVGLFTLVPLSNPIVPAGIQLPPVSELGESVYLISDDGRAFSGSDAIAVLASVMPRTRWLGRLLMLPGIKQMARPIYRLIARHRLKLTRLISNGR